MSPGKKSGEIHTNTERGIRILKLVLHVSEFYAYMVGCKYTPDLDMIVSPNPDNISIQI
jgi:hypothetical protein